MVAFRERVKSKVREDIAAMIPDEAIEQMVREVIKDEFFKDRVKKDDYGRESERKKSWFVEAVVQAAEPIVKDHIQTYITNNEHVLERALGEVLNPNNLTLLAVRAFSSEVGGAINHLSDQFREAINQSRNWR